MQEMLQEISKLNEEQKSSIEQLSNENTALATTVKKLRRDLRIQKQVSDEYSQKIEELKKTFSRTEDQAKDAIELMKVLAFRKIIGTNDTCIRNISILMAISIRLMIQFY